MSENYSQPILNPNVYLNYLDPASASEYEITRDIYLVTFGALSWDILSSLPDDYKLVRTATKPSPVLFAYFASRTCALAVVLMSILTKTGPVQNCGALQLINSLFWILASASSSYLFLKRVHAVFPQERLVCHAFTALWIASVGASAVILPASWPLADDYQIANTGHCMNVSANNYIAVAFTVPVFFDALVYGAVSYKILRFHPIKKAKSWKARCSGETLPHLSRAILTGGQKYYGMTNGINIARTSVALSPNISPILQLAPLVPAVALTSVMACRVFRNLKFESLEKVEIGYLTTLRCAERDPVNINAQAAPLQKDTDILSSEAHLDHC